MRTLCRSLLFLLLSVSSYVQALPSVGFSEMTLDERSERPLNIAIWYPTSAEEHLVAVADNPVLEGVQVIRNGAPLPGQHSLIVMSHGYGGSWRNLSWLADALARQGYVVAAPNHPGTTTFNKDKAQAKQSWQRPHDLSRVIDALTSSPRIAGDINADKIAVIGHSLGGWTVIAASGGQFSPALFKKDCESHPVLKNCQLSSELGLDQDQIKESMKDPRIKAVVSLDAGLVRGFSPASLEKITIPSLVIAAGVDIANIPAELESGHLTHFLPKAHSHSVTIADATHFSFMQVCKPQAVEMLKEESPGDEIICRDGGTRARTAIHDEITDLVTDFLSKAFSDGSP